MIDWTKPIEAVHPNGQVIHMALAMRHPDHAGDYKTIDAPAGDANEWWYANGESRCGSVWYIRNRAEPANDELAELRAFKEAAIARFPELAEPETDEAAAVRLNDQYDEDTIKTSYDLAVAAIAWARANPR